MAEEKQNVEYDYLITATAKEAIQNLARMGEHLKSLKAKMDAAEIVYEDAKKEYNYYASSVLPMEMFNVGMEECKLMSGGVLRYERKFYCQPNKNDADKRKMAEWLRANGGEDLVKEKAQVDAAKIELLKAAGIPFTEIDDINTNSLKAFLKDKIGASGGTAQLQVQDIPECMHFQEVGVVSIDV